MNSSLSYLEKIGRNILLSNKSKKNEYDFGVQGMPAGGKIVNGKAD